MKNNMQKDKLDISILKYPLRENMYLDKKAINYKIIMYLKITKAKRVKKIQLKM